MINTTPHASNSVYGRYGKNCPVTARASGLGDDFTQWNQS